jgi:hypothetical protein
MTKPVGAKNPLFFLPLLKKAKSQAAHSGHGHKPKKPHHNGHGHHKPSRTGPRIPVFGKPVFSTNGQSSLEPHNQIGPSGRIYHNNHVIGRKQ